LSALDRVRVAHKQELIEAAEDGKNWVESIVATHAAYMQAIERVLGAPSNSLYRADAAAVSVWVAALQLDLSPERRRQS
jgi:hypothetical protein